MNGWPTDHHVKTIREIAGHRPQSYTVTGQRWKIGGLVNVASRPSFNDVQRQPQLASQPGCGPLATTILTREARLESLKLHYVLTSSPKTDVF